MKQILTIVITTPAGEIVHAADADKKVAELTIEQLERELSEAKCKLESQKKS